MTEPRPKCEDCKYFIKPPVVLGEQLPDLCLHTGKSALWERAVNIGQVVNCGPNAQFFKAARKKVQA